MDLTDPTYITNVPGLELVFGPGDSGTVWLSKFDEQPLMPSRPYQVSGIKSVASVDSSTVGE
jgi:hypothetical protein